MSKKNKTIQPINNDLDGYDLIQWGTKAIEDNKTYSFEHYIIPNRFDFGGDAQGIIRRSKISIVEPEQSLPEIEKSANDHK